MAIMDCQYPVRGLKICVLQICEDVGQEVIGVFSDFGLVSE